jgi:hypothetical protein
MLLDTLEELVEAGLLELVATDVAVELVDAGLLELVATDVVAELVDAGLLELVATEVVATEELVTVSGLPEQVGKPKTAPVLPVKPKVVEAPEASVPL